MPDGKGLPQKMGGRARRGLVRDVLINWLRFDTSIFHDSFPATESNVRRVILELERFPGCYVAGDDSFTVDKVAEWVRINAAPFAERMEPPPFINTPPPMSAKELGVAPHGAPPTDDEVRQIHLESSVWDKLDVVQAAEGTLDDANSPVIMDDAPPEPPSPLLDEEPEEAFAGELASEEQVPPGDPGGAVEDGFDAGETLAGEMLAPRFQAEEGFVDEGEGAAVDVEGHRQGAGTGYVRADHDEQGGEVFLAPEIDELAGHVLEEVNNNLDAGFENPGEAVDALGSAYRGLKEGLVRLITEVKALTGREVGKVKDPGLQLEAVRGAIRDTVENLRQQVKDRQPGESDKEKDEELTRLKNEVGKLRGALENQFEITSQIRAAFKKITQGRTEKMAKKPVKKAVKKVVRKPVTKPVRKSK